MRRFNVQGVAPDAYERLSKGVDFEDVGKGRKGTVLVDDGESGCLPVVRTTTSYERAAQRFGEAHQDIIAKLISQCQSVSQCPEGLAFNNCLIEVYDGRYRRMGYHSDQATDLAPDSWICVFSCYVEEDDGFDNLRLLKIKDKTTGELSSIVMEQHSAILWSVTTNRKFLHKIVLQDTSREQTPRWLGMTLRLSRRFVTPERPIRLAANEEERKQFFAWRRRENKEIHFEWPDFDYTISPSDLLGVR